MDQKEATEEKRLKLQDNRMEINRLKNIEKLRKCHLREQKKLMNPKECLKVNIVKQKHQCNVYKKNKFLLNNYTYCNI